MDNRGSVDSVGNRVGNTCPTTPWATPWPTTPWESPWPTTPWATPPTTAPCPRWLARPDWAVLLTESEEATEAIGEPKLLAWLVVLTSPWKGLDTDWWDLWPPATT